MKRFKGIQKIIILLLLAAFALQGVSWTRAEGTTSSMSGTLTAQEPVMQGRTGQVEMKTTASAMNDSVLSHVFANMFNEAMARQAEEALNDEEEWEDPSLEEYPLDPHELWEYGDSPRVRLVTMMDEEGNPLPVQEGEESYFVYRDSFLILTEEESIDYALEYGPDHRTATIYPALPADDLEGKNGIVLLRDTISEDEILVFAEKPVEENDEMVISLQDPDTLTLNMIFSDGSLSYNVADPEITMEPEKENTPAETLESALSEEDSETDEPNELNEDNENDALTGLEDADAKGSLLPQVDLASKIKNAPKRAASGVSDVLSSASDYFSGLLNNYSSKSISGTNWSGTAYWRPADLSIRISPDVNVLKLRFNMNITIGTETKFEITSTGSTGSRQTSSIGSVSINAVITSFMLDYSMEVQFNEVPVHVIGTIHNDITFSIGLSPLHISSSEAMVDYAAIDIDDAYANRQAEFYVGNSFGFQGDFLQIKADLGLFTVNVGPIVSLQCSFGGGSSTKATRERDTETSNIDRKTVNSIHSCVIKGREGCLHAASENKGFYRVKLKIDLYLKKWNFDPSSGDTSSGTTNYYNSYTEKTGLKKGTCPYRLYRVPVTVWLRESDESASTVPGATVQQGYMTDTNPEVIALKTDVTDSNGNGVVYLPAGNERVAASVTTPEAMSAISQPYRVQETGNETLNIYLTHDTNAKVTVNKVWNIDQELQDRPQSTQFVVEKLNMATGVWEIAHRKSQPSMPALLTVDNFEAFKKKTATATFTDLEISTVAMVKDGNTLKRVLTANQYRVRELDDIYVQAADESPAAFEERLKKGIIADSGDTELKGTGEPNLVTRWVPAYITLTGEKVSEHETRYKVEYAPDSGTGSGDYAFTVTNTPVLEIDIYKRWINVSEVNRPSSVYLTLLRCPKEGWLERVDGTGLTGEWPATEVLEGEMHSLRELSRIGAVEIDLPVLSDTQMAFGRVSEENDWHLHYLVPKYIQGIPMDYIAEEMNADTLHMALLQQTGLSVDVFTFSGTGYQSIRGQAVAVENDWQLTASVLNIATDSNVIGGVKYWRLTGDLTAADLPESVTIHVKSSGGAVDKDVIIQRPSTVTYDYEGVMWPWTLELPDSMKTETFTITEETIPAEYAREVEKRIEGLNVVNTPLRYSDAKIRLTKSWDPGYFPDNLPVYVTISYNGNSERVMLRRYNDPEVEYYTADLDFDWLKPVTREVLDGLKIEETTTVDRVTPYYSGPTLTIKDGQPVYTYNIVNIRNTVNSFRGQVVKTWDLGGLTAEQIGITENTTYTASVYLNGNTKSGTATSRKVLDILSKSQTLFFGYLKNSDGSDVSDKDPATGAKNTFSIKEEISGFKVLQEGELNENGGFRMKITSVEDRGDSRQIDRTWYVTNTWEPVDENTTYQAKGTVKWEDKDDALAVRPDSVQMTIFNSNGEKVKTFTVSANDGWQWSVKGLPEKDAAGKTLDYYIVEEHPQGYTRTYSPEYGSTNYRTTGYNTSTRTWTLNVTNTLTGYYTLNVDKMLLSTVNADRDRTYTFEITAHSQHDESWERLLPYRATGLAETGSVQTLNLPGNEGTWSSNTSGTSGTAEHHKQGTYEFLFNEEGNHLYTVREVAPTPQDPNDEMDYDATVWAVIVHAEKGEDGKLNFTTYVRVLPEEIKKIGPSKEDGIGIDISEVLNDEWARTNTVSFTNVRNGNRMLIAKTWDVDQAQEDNPEEVQVLIETSTDGTTWNRVGTITNPVTIKASEGWVKQVVVPENAGEKNAKYRVREVVSEQTTGSEEQATNQVIEPGKNVTYQVPEHAAKAGGETVATHNTTYRVTYDELLSEAGVFFVRNQAVENVTVKKEWIDCDEKPEFVYLALMGRPVDGSEDDDNILHGRFVTNPIDGGMTRETLAGEINSIDSNANINGQAGASASIAIAKVSETKNWQASFVVPKYRSGVEMEYWGVELDEKLLNQLVKEFYYSDHELTYIQTGNFVSLPGKAFNSSETFAIGKDEQKKLKQAAMELSEAQMSEINTAFSGMTRSDTSLASLVVNVAEPKDTILVKKEWDIDLEKLDHPASIKAVVQQEKDGKWTTIEGGTVTLSAENEWAYRVDVTGIDKTTIRVRELKGEQGLLNQLKQMAKEYTDAKEAEFKEYIDKVKKEIDGYTAGLTNNIPELNEFKSMLDGKTKDVADRVKNQTDDWYKALWENIDNATQGSGSRIVYAKDDTDNTAEDKSKYKAAVTFHVDEYTSMLSGGTVMAHDTKYYVSYSNKGDTYTIKNQAILEIDVKKHWVHLGNGKDDHPDSAWVVLMFQPKSGAMDQAGNLAKAAGVDLSGLQDIQLPAFSLLRNSILQSGLLEGGDNPVALLSKMTVGFNIDIFHLFDNLLKVAIEKVNDGNEWTAHFVHTKYMLGLPIEFEGDEVTSEIIRLVVKYFTKIDPHISFNPLQGYVSIGTPALPTFKDFSMDSLNLSTLSSAAKSLLTSNWEGLAKSMADTVLDQTHLAAHVINLQISTDDDDDPGNGTIKGEKVWVNDEENNRPDSLTIKLWQGSTLIGSTELKKSDHQGESNWAWSIKLPEGKSKKSTYTVTEEYPADYSDDNKAKYQTTISGYTIYNTWDAVTIAGQKTWLDGDNADNNRPETLIIFLKRADGQPLKDLEGNALGDLYVVTSADSNWEYAFPNMPGKASDYKVEEKTGKVTISEQAGKVVKTLTELKDVTGYTVEYDGLNIINTRSGEISGTKFWLDDHNNDGIRPASLKVTLQDANDNTIAGPMTVTGNSTDEYWNFTFTNVPLYDKEGNEIEFQAVEDEIDKYVKFSFGMNLVNVHGTDKIPVSVKKVWEDANDQDGKRPANITVELYGNGKLVKTMTAAASQGNSQTLDFGEVNVMEQGKPVDYEVKEKEIDGYTAAYTMEADASAIQFVITNTHTPEKTSVSGKKTWDDQENGYNTRPENITITLYANGTQKETKTVSSADEWAYSFSNLDKYANKKEIQYTVQESTVRDYLTPVYKKTANGYDITNRLDATSITGQKIWNDADNQDGKRPSAITLVLHATANGATVDGAEEQTLQVTEEDGWRYTFRNLPKYVNDATHAEISYSVTEQEIEGYTVSYGEVRRNAEGGFIQDLTNTHTPERMDISGEKTWWDDDDRDGKRPASITVRLYREGKELASQTVIPDANGNWRYTFTDLPKYEKGEKIVYTVDEEPVDEYIHGTLDYRSLINFRMPEMVNIQVTKQWDDADDQDGIRPESVFVALRANGGLAGNCILSEENDWTWTWEFMPMNEAGESIHYLPRESEIEGYEAEYQAVGYDQDTNTWSWVIVNHHTPEVTEISGQKTWMDLDDQDGIRPDSIWVTLYDGDQQVASRNVTAEHDWKYSFENLPKYRRGQEMVYTVKEQSIPGYTDFIHGNDVINVHVPEQVKIKVTKEWDDADDLEGFRPESVTVAVMEDGEILAEQELSAENNWTYTFDYLSAKVQGQVVSYAVIEYEVPEYTTEYQIGDYDAETATWSWKIINHHQPTYIDLSGEKTWEDGNDQDGRRPEFITVYLYADEELRDTRTVTPDADGTWKYTFEHLPRYGNGKENHYYVTEEMPLGYVYVTDGEALVNYQTPGKVNIRVNKVWDDADDQDGIRPGSVQIALRGDGGNAGHCEITAEDGWTWTWKDFPMYHDGEPISFNVIEYDVDGYTTEYSANDYDPETNTWIWTITNRHTPETITISGKKEWEDQDNEGILRPEAIRVYLYQGSADNLIEVDSQIATAANSWSYTFENLPKYENGKEIRYTVSEGLVNGYLPVISNADIRNIHVPEEINIRVNKVWEDMQDLEEVRPEKITLTLYANEQAIITREVTAADGWTATFENLPTWFLGKAVNYRVMEKTVDDYFIVCQPTGYESRTQTWVWTATNWHETEQVTAEYRVEFYYQKDGIYPETPDSQETRIGNIGEEVTVTEEDRNNVFGRYSLDLTAGNIFSGTVAADGSLVLKLYFRPYYIITYDPNGGMIDGGTDPVSTRHFYGEEITIHAAARREGYTFEYWRGSAYYPGEKYTVTEDHTFVAKWTMDNRLSYSFKFTKKWVGSAGDGINWILYNSDGTVIHKLFNKKVISATEWRYEAWFETDAEYYLVEEVPAGYSVRYENVGKYADVTDRLYNGGTIINYQIPKTGDRRNTGLWIALALISLAGMGAAIALMKKRKRQSKP